MLCFHVRFRQFWDWISALQWYQSQTTMLSMIPSFSPSGHQLSCCRGCPRILTIKLSYTKPMGWSQLISPWHCSFVRGGAGFESCFDPRHLVTRKKLWFLVMLLLHFIREYVASEGVGGLRDVILSVVCTLLYYSRGQLRQVQMPCFPGLGTVPQRCFCPSPDIHSWNLIQTFPV